MGQQDDEALFLCIDGHAIVVVMVALPDHHIAGEISSDLYGLSWCDILNLTFCRLDFHQLLIKIS